ncbi:hypothetical protein BCL79_1839 [Stenotrophomonas rhizophila]|uniref:Uncharacterized protein n=1 Tax=Stenotrophomonas rhizophila TaxID=216778 RepID=A0A498CK65_9GAMM|nr:hypothetical protein [Stenotrophomonas rhizophila]RLK57433.1 hypothetical protein BCL79_1839 [Stenotrophomonas rhizophila]
MSELDVIIPPTRTVRFRGEQVQVTPLRLQQIGPFITASRTIIARVAMMVGAVDTAPAAATGAILLDLLEQDSADLAGALAVAVGRDGEWIAGGTLDEVADLLEAVVGLNRDFFAHRLRRLLMQAEPLAEESTDSATSSSS